MTNTCSTGKSSIAAQTLFLGASISDFNVNMAWGGRPSQLSVKLVEDTNCIKSDNSVEKAPFKAASYPDNHFHDCSSNEDCFIDETGKAYDLSKIPAIFAIGKGQ